MDYKVYHRDGNYYTIRGDTLADAVEKNFSVIAQNAGIGNVAGYTLDRVWMEYENGEVLLHIVSHGSDGLINYDPRTDVPKERTVRIQASEADCPKRHEFELNEEEEKPFDPFAPLSDPGAIFGTARAIMDFVAEHRCAETQFMMSSFVHPSVTKTQPDKALLLMSNRLHHLHPKKDRETQKLVDRASELVAAFTERGYRSVPDNYLFYEAKTSLALERAGNVTALAKARKDAGLTQQELADKVGISLRQLIRYEDKNRSSLGEARHSVVVALAEAVGVRPEDLVDRGLVVLI